MDNDTRSALRELGQAWRTDGHHYGPHSILTHLRDVENVADAQITLAQFRNENGLCPSGRGHWSKHCQDDC